MKRSLPAVLLLLSFSLTALAARDRLYSSTDPSASGGIRGTVILPRLPMEQVLAIPPDEPALVYKGRVTGDKRRSFAFSGLPMRKYDLIVIYADRFYEGLRLHRAENTLTADDVAAIEDIVQRSEPFFTRKVIHRVEGRTGRGNFCRCICTFLREKSSLEQLEIEKEEHRRTFKLIVLKDVGPGWQIVRTRDLYPVYIQPGAGAPKHAYSGALQGVRVTDYVKDLGEIDLETN